MDFSAIISAHQNRTAADTVHDNHPVVRYLTESLKMAGDASAQSDSIKLLPAHDTSPGSRPVDAVMSEFQVAQKVAPIILASLCGFRVIPTQIKVVFDAIFKPLSESFVEQLLARCGWTLADYQRGYLAPVSVAIVNTLLILHSDFRSLDPSPHHSSGDAPLYKLSSWSQPLSRRCFPNSRR